MTVREMLQGCENVDEDVLDYEIGIIATAQLNRTIRISMKCSTKNFPENVDVENKTLWIKCKTE